MVNHISGFRKKLFMKIKYSDPFTIRAVEATIYATTGGVKRLGNISFSLETENNTLIFTRKIVFNNPILKPIITVNNYPNTTDESLTPEHRYAHSREIGKLVNVYPIIKLLTTDTCIVDDVTIPQLICVGYTMLTEKYCQILSTVIHDQYFSRNTDRYVEIETFISSGASIKGPVTVDGTVLYCGWVGDDWHSTFYVAQTPVEVARQLSTTPTIKKHLEYEVSWREKIVDKQWRERFIVKESSENIIIPPLIIDDNTYYCGDIKIVFHETVDHQYWKANIDIDILTEGEYYNGYDIEMMWYHDMYTTKIYGETLENLLTELNNSELLENIMSNYNLVKSLLTEVVKDIEEELVFV